MAKKTPPTRSKSGKDETDAGVKTGASGVPSQKSRVEKPIKPTVTVKAGATGKKAEGGQGKTTKVKAPDKVKTNLDRKQLAHFRELLLVKRADLIGDLNGMEDSALRGQDRSNLSNMPLHMADVGSDNYDQELTLGLMESERKLLQEINDALVRVNEGTFGICQSTGKPINKARLEAKPWAKYCIEAAREMERNGGDNNNHASNYNNYSNRWPEE